MKKKLTINTLALGNLRQRKKQYTIMIIGIILAMVFSSGIIFYIFSYNETMSEKARNEIGDQAAIIYIKESTDEFYQQMIADDMIDDYGYSHIIGYSYSREDEENMGCAVAWLDDKAKEISYQSFIDGSYPVNADEIAVEKTALVRLGYPDIKVGDTIRLRLYVQNDDELMEAVEKSYKLTGIVTDKKYSEYRNSYSSAGKDTLIPAAFVAQETNTELGGKEKLCAYIENENKSYKWDDSLRDYLFNIKKADGYIDSLNTSRAHLNSVFSSSGMYAIFMAAVLSLTSCVAIINSFNTNLKERKKQIGMMRAVGATKRQIINIFAREALIIALICTPISLAISYAAVRLALNILKVDVVITHSIWVLPVSAIVGVAVVMAAAFIPLTSAARITPIQSIRDISTNRKMKTKNIRTKKEYNTSSLLAKRNLTFFKGGRIAVSIMLMAAILFSCWGFSYIAYEKKHPFNYKNDYMITNLGNYYSDAVNFKDQNNGMTEVDMQEIKAIPYITSINARKRIAALIHIKELNSYYQSLGDTHWLYEMMYDENTELTTDNFYEIMMTKSSEDYKQMKSALNAPNEIFPTEIISYDTETLNNIDKSIVQGKIDLNKLNSGEEIILVAPQKAALGVYLSPQGGGWSITTIAEDDDPGDNTIIVSGESSYQVGDTIDMDIVTYQHEEDYQADSSEFERESKQVKIGAIISPKYFADNPDIGISSYNNLFFLTTTQGMNNYYQNAKYSDLNINCDAEITDETDKQITTALQPYLDKYDASFTSNFAMLQRQERDLQILIVSMLALVIISFSICGSIINNSLTARIRENKKELGTLRAFGADISELVKSYVKQLLAMFSWGIGLGFGGYLILYLIDYIVQKRLGSESIKPFSPWVTIVFCIILFAVCSINLWVKIKKEMKNSIIENIREL